MVCKAKPDPVVLDVLLRNGRYCWDSLFVFQSFIHDLGSSYAEIINDALHCFINAGDFGCPEDEAVAIMWCLYLDAMGHNAMKPEYDVLRNGVASYLLQQKVDLMPFLPEEVTGDG